MKENVLISITGRHLTDEDENTIETKQPGKYAYFRGKHIIRYEEYPELEDFGEAVLVGDNGARNYFRVDWFTPDGLSTWGDGRTFILGTDGTIELRKYVNAGVPGSGPDHLLLVNGKGEQHIECHGKVGFPFFGQLILDCLNRTENAMTQEHAFKAAQLCLEAQQLSDSRK